jgi:hypothetical protein
MSPSAISLPALRHVRGPNRVSPHVGQRCHSTPFGTDGFYVTVMSEKIYSLISASYEMVHMFDINGEGGGIVQWLLVETPLLSGL